MPIATKRGYKLRQCKDCGLIFVNPQPTRGCLARLYRKSAGYFATAETDLSETSPQYALTLAKILSAHGIEKGRFLDVGCSTGTLIYHIRHLGWNVTGTEINTDAAAIARQNNLDVVLGELEECPFDAEAFDVIHISDVIEHVRSPRGTLLAAHRFLKENGLIILRTTNATCGFAVSSLMLAKLFRFPWLYSEAPYHLYDFYPETLSRLVSSVGFEILSADCSGHTSFLYTVGASGFFDDLNLSIVVLNTAPWLWR